MAITISGTNGIVGAGFTVDNSGVSVTAGVGTFGTLAAPAAGLTGALPAISGANLTNLPAANLTGSLPAISGASLTGITAGITQADIYRFTTTASLSYDTVAVITPNWERPDESDDVFDKIGSGMSESSGIFTFPATGIYFISFIARFYGNGNTAGANHIYIDATVNNSSYTTVAQSATYVGNSYQATVISQTMVDITDTSNRKVRFKVYAGANNQQLLGNSTKNETFVTFIRLGDT